MASRHHTIVLAVLTCMLCACTVQQTEKTASILFVGDTSYYEHYNVAAKMLKEKGYDYPFENYDKILEESDFVIANLESIITDLRESPYEGMKTYILWQSPQVLSHLKKHNIDAVNIANNHVMDFEMPGLLQSMGYLASADIPFFGAGINEKEASKPYYKDLKIGDRVFKFAVLSGLQYFKLLDETYNFYASEDKGGAVMLDSKAFMRQIQSIKKNESDRFVIVFPHWGYNYTWHNKDQRALAEQFIEAGADIVIGHGAHKIQEIERIDDTWVAYDLGNFVFCSWGRYEKKGSPPYSFIGSLRVTPQDDDDFSIALRLYPIFTDNSKTDFQGHMATEEEFEDIWNILLEKSIQQDILTKQVLTGQDQYGRYLEMPVN